MIRILVVEDSATSRQLLVSFLQDDPEISVIGQAENGRQAVEMAAELGPDLITMDVVMPDMDGLEATRQIMAARPTPIVIVTAHAGNSPGLNIVFEAMAAGALDVISKPSLGRDGVDEWRRDFLDKVKALVQVEHWQMKIED